MKPRTGRTVWPKFEDDVGKREAAIASADSLFAKGDLTLVAAAKNENRQGLKFWSNVTREGFSSQRGA
jgi:hypothetical protein